MSMPRIGMGRTIHMIRKCKAWRPLALCAMILGFGILIGYGIWGCAAYIIPTPAFDSLEEIGDWVKETIEYIPDDPGEDDWQTPRETLARGAGDCEDRAILWMKLAYDNLGIEAELIGIDIGYNHAYTRIGDEYWDLTHKVGMIYLYRIIWVSSYELTMYLAEEWW